VEFLAVDIFLCNCLFWHELQTMSKKFLWFGMNCETTILSAARCDRKQNVARCDKKSVAFFATKKLPHRATKFFNQCCFAFFLQQQNFSQ
jgi:hypothetical protein